MKSSEFAGKFKSKYLWGNIFAMVVVVVLLCLGVKFGLDFYTHHGEAIPVPNVRHKSFEDAEHILKDANLEIVVNDTGYVKTLPPDCILEQSPEPGDRVKSGHVIYVTINSPHTPTLSLPDLIDNSSLREAMAKLSSMGFKLTQPQYISGEKDWVYGILVKGRHVVAGDKIAIEDALTIQVGNGMRGESDSVDYVDPTQSDDSYGDESGTEDNFVEVTDPQAEGKKSPVTSSSTSSTTSKEKKE